MNLLLLRSGYPPLVVRPEDRPDYLDAIERYQLQWDSLLYDRFMLERLEASLDDYLSFLAPGASANNTDVPTEP